MATSEEVAWLAGILEGEGSFMNPRNIVNGKSYFYPRIVVNMTDEDIIARVAALFGTSVYAIPIQPNRKQAYRAQTNGSNAAEWMVKIRPLMGERRGAKIDEILAAYGDIEPTSVRRARSCREAWERRGFIPKTHCNLGHELSGENLRIIGKKRARRCRTCDNERSRLKMAARRASKEVK